MELDLNGNLVRIADIDITERKRKRRTEYLGSLEDLKDADLENNAGTTIQIWLKSRNWRRVTNTHIAATMKKTDNQSDRCILTE